MTNFTQANITDLGLELNAKIQAARGDVPLHITRVALGAGISETPTSQTDVITPIDFFVPIIRQVAHGLVAEIQIQITNVGNPDRAIAPLLQPVIFQQIGFFAVDPDRGEILYRISRLDSAAFIPAATDFPYTVAPKYIFRTANADNVIINVDPAGLVTIRMLDEHNRDLQAHENLFAAAIRGLTDMLNEHINRTVASNTPPHGIRFLNGRLEVWHNRRWHDVGGIVIPPGSGTGYGEGGYGEGGYGGITNGWFSVNNGILSNDITFGEVIEGKLIFNPGTAAVDGNQLNLR